MKKATLLNLKTMYVSKKNKDMVEQDKGEEKTVYNYGEKRVRVYKYYKYYRAEIERGILKVAIFTREKIAQGEKEPKFTIFIDKKEEKWLSYEHGADKWYTAMIFNLPIHLEKGESFGSYEWCNDKDCKIIQDYLGEEGSAKKAIRMYQTKIKKCAIKEKYRKETERIDEFMQSVPDLPKDFGKWIVNSAFKNDSYIITKPGKSKEGYCTNCKREVQLRMKPRHNTEGKCPKCRAEVEYKSFGRQNLLICQKNVGIIQKIKDERLYVLRVFDTAISFSRDTEYKIMNLRCTETFRFKLDDYFFIREDFEFGLHKQSGVNRWKKPSYSWSKPTPTTYCVLYEKNLDLILSETKAKYVPLKQFLRKNKGSEVTVENMLKICLQHPNIEKLMKLGLNRLSFSLIRREMVADEIKLDRNSASDILQIDKRYLKVATEIDASLQELRVMQAAHRERKCLSKESICSMAKFYDFSRIDDIQMMLGRNTEKLLHYLEKVHIESGNNPRWIGRDYKDYLSQLDKLGIPLDKHNRFPANFYSVHESLSEQIKEKEKEIKKAEIEKQNQILRDRVSKLEKLYHGKSDKFEIVWPKTKEDFQREGQLQHNCVGGYFERVVKGETVVFFLRRKGELDKPFCTVEFENEKLIQCRIIYNKEAPVEAQEFMKVIARNYSKECSRIEEEKASSNIGGRNGRDSKDIFGIQT